MEYLSLYFIFFKIGLFTIGGGYAMIPLIQQELIQGGYLTIQEVTDVIAISEMTPGPFAINAATFVGMKLHALPGAAVCTIGLITPSLIIMTIVALFFFNINQKAGVQAVLYGVRPVVWALIIFATISVAKTVLTGDASPLSFNIPCIAVFVVVFCCMRLIKKVSPIVFICAAGLVGAVFLR